jgi:hypothetical protein
LEWVTVGYDYHGTKNWMMALLNRVSSLDEGEVASFKNCSGCIRDVIQEWRRGEDDCLLSDPAVGTRRKIRQTYGEFRDAWAAGGKSWYWSPAVPNVASRSWKPDSLNITP